MKKCIILVIKIFTAISLWAQQNTLKLNDKEYFESRGLNVMVFQDIYPEGHQGGVAIIQNGERTATNGDLRLEPTPGQWSPIPVMKKREVDKTNNQIRVNLTYPDSSRNRKGFNPINYPDLYFNYTVTVTGTDNSFEITVDIDRPLPQEWIGKAGFNIELFPGLLFGKSWAMGSQSGVFPRQANGPSLLNSDKKVSPVPYAAGPKLVVAGECDGQRMVIESSTGDLQLIDGRTNHNNGWFVVRSLVPQGATKGAIHWKITANTIPDWIYEPVIHLSQIGYHPQQAKIAVIETDPNDVKAVTANLYKITENGSELVLTDSVKLWGNFLRYTYYKFDVSQITSEGMYYIEYKNVKSNPFRIGADVYERHAWQPVLDYFLPIQMCHMRVNENYRVWHGECHTDDALMAPVDTNHFDGYAQGPSTLTKYKPMEHVPGLNLGGWHDAGDDDLRVESQAGEVYILSMIYENFNVNYDNTLIDQSQRLTEIQHPDGKPDILQQIEHGALSVVSGYQSLGRLYRGIICPTLDQYVLMGDVSNQTDRMFYNPGLKPYEKAGMTSGNPDDRWVFTENNPGRELSTAGQLAAASRVLKGYNDTLAAACLSIATELWNKTDATGRWAAYAKMQTAVELFITTGKPEFSDYILKNQDFVCSNIGFIGWQVGKILPKINNKKFNKAVRDAVAQYAKQVETEGNETPFGVPYKPHIWGAGWGIQDFGVKQYFLHQAFPDLIPKDYILNALNFILGCHPGENTASFASGVGAKSATTAYGYNRADWSYIPGGVVSGTALIRPDFPELKEFPYLWQQTEYVLGGGSSNYMFLVLAANVMLN